ncbi:MAG TPA: class I SAM-dependent methyltransferase [Armatimonadota bacterium]|jgi:ubiquinone/menaquinone biosynthesis C-methylase UbiE
MSKLGKAIKTGAVAAVCGIGLCAVAKKLKLTSRLADVAHSVEGVPFPGVNLYSFLASKQLRSLYAQIAEEITGVFSGQQILDLNTGVGLLPLEIAERNPNLHVIGLDKSSEMIQVAQVNAKAARVRPCIEFNVGEPTNLPFPGRYFDLVVSVNALHHWTNPAVVMDEVFHVLKPGGEFWIYDYRCDVSEEIWDTAQSELPLYLALPFMVGPKASWKAACSDEKMLSLVKVSHFEQVSVEKRTFKLYGREMPVFNRILLKKPEQAREE